MYMYILVDIILTIYH